jgi:hypothetical protein
MRMRFGPNDEKGFLATQATLLERFERWLQDDRALPAASAVELAGNASLALDWKWSYADGDLGLWRTTDVADFLLDWCPRKLSVSQADCVPIPEALAAFTRFLQAVDLLARGSSPVDDLAQVATELTDEFVTAMGDSSNFGMAKSLFGAAAADNVDLRDPEQLQEWMAEFNARPEEERRRLIPDTALAPRRPTRPALPPVAMPDEDAVTASRAEAPILASFARLAEFVGAGRKLTQTGNLTLADARVLVDLLKTGDTMDEQIGSRTFKTKSAAELPRLRLVFAWAKKAGVLRVVHGRVVATKRALGADPGALFDRATGALLSLGVLSAQRDPHWWRDVNQLLDQFAVHLLAGPYAVQGPLPIDDLTEVAAAAVLDTFSFPNLADESVARMIGGDIVDIVDAFELAGVLRRADTVDPEDPTLSARRTGGTVELTPAGVVMARQLLMDAGYDAPVAGRFAASSAAELLIGTDEDDFAVVWGELQAWQGRRSPTEAAAGLADAVRTLEDPALRNLALAVLGEIDLDIAGLEVRRLCAEPGSRGFALCWLVDHGLEDGYALFDPADVSWFVDVLAQRLVRTGPDGLCDTLALAGGHEDQIRVIGQLWRSPSTATEAVLAAIGELHPSKAVAKAARKALFQRRSWSAQLG